MFGLAIADKWRALHEIIYEVLERYSNFDGSQIPVIAHLVRAMNALRSKGRPKGPRSDDPNFEDVSSYFPDGLPRRNIC